MGLAANWRNRSQRLGLVGEVCPHCDQKIFPPRDVCPYCHGPAKVPFQMSGTGVVYSYSVMHHAPAGYETALPYAVALVKLDEGPLITAQLTDVDLTDVHIGMAVEMVTRKMRTEGADGLIYYNYKFRPTLERVAVS